jgi:hypothetical protein
MPYTDFDLDTLRHRFTLTIQTQNLFPNIVASDVPLWLQQTLDKGMSFALLSEKSRSEFIIVPFLLTVRDLVHESITIYSGQRLDGDASVGLTGECDFILAPRPPLPIIQAPIISIVEAKKNDIEGGFGQCAAQILGAQRFNLRDNTGIDTIYGCITTGEAWQFLKLTGSELTIDSERYYITELGVVLSIFVSIITPFIPQVVHE